MASGKDYRTDPDITDEERARLWQQEDDRRKEVEAAMLAAKREEDSLVANPQLVSQSAASTASPLPPPRPPVVAPPQMPPPRMPALPEVESFEQVPGRQPGRGYMGPMLQPGEFEQLPPNTITNRAQRPLVMSPDQQQAQVHSMAQATNRAVFPDLTSRDPTAERFATNALINRRVADGMPREDAIREAVMMHPGLFGTGQKPLSTAQQSLDYRKTLDAQKREDALKKPVIVAGSSYVQQPDKSWKQIGTPTPQKLGPAELEEMKITSKALGVAKANLSALRQAKAKPDKISAAIAEVDDLQSELDKYKTRPAESPAAGRVSMPDFARPPLLQGTPSQDRVRVKNKDGKIGTIPASQLEEALKQGWKRL